VHVADTNQNVVYKLYNVADTMYNVALKVKFNPSSMSGKTLLIKKLN